LQTVKELVGEVTRLEAVREEREQQLFAWRDDIFNILGEQNHSQKGVAPADC
jgi:hypothetical protein